MDTNHPWKSEVPTSKRPICSAFPLPGLAVSAVEGRKSGPLDNVSPSAVSGNAAGGNACFLGSPIRISLTRYVDLVVAFAAFVGHQFAEA